MSEPTQRELLSLEKDTMHLSTLTMAAEEMIYNISNFELNPNENLSFQLNTKELIKYINHFSDEQNEIEVIEDLILNHNNALTLLIDTPKGELFKVTGFFEFSPYDNSQITLLSESIELVE